MRRIGACAGALIFLMSAAFAEDPATTAPASGTTVSTQSQDGQWEGIFNEDTRFYWWQSSRGFAFAPTVPSPLGLSHQGIILPAGFPAAASPGSGSLLYTPFALQLIGRPSDDLKSEFLVRGGYVDASQTTPGMSGQVSTQTDTSITEKVTYLGLAGLQPFASVSINIPTGKTALLGNSANARMDPDLVEIPTYGEGWNIGPRCQRPDHADANYFFQPRLYQARAL